MGLRFRCSPFFVAGLVLMGAASSAAASVTVSPAPGTPDASPATQISILGVRPSRIASVRVTGSSTGAHAGRLRAYSGNRGASFVLSRPFAQSERVAVRIRLRPRGTVSEAFTVAHLAPVPGVLNIPVTQPAKLQHFVSRPDLLPPKISVLRAGASGGGDIFLTPLPSPVVHPESNNAISIHPVGPGGPMIIDPRGNLVWFDQIPPPDVATNLRLQRFGGRQVLTWWQGPVTVSAFGIGEGVIADPSYRTVRTVRPGNGYLADLHEFALTGSGDALFTIYSPVLVHLPGSAPGSLSPLLDSMVQEVDVRTGLVVWEWHAYGHIPLRDSYATPSTSADYDAYHLNSIELERGDRVLVSARDTSAVYLIDRRTGQIAWTLGGKASSFRLGAGARFYFQHDARFRGADEVTLFDDEAGPPFEAPSSRGLVLRLDRRHRRASVVRSYRRPGNDTLAQSEGSLQTLPGGNVFVGFGSTQFFSEFSPAGRLVFDAALPVDDGTYRVFRAPWSAKPRTRPDLVVKRGSATGLVAYASWNGATAVARWRMIAGSTAGPTVRRSGFETQIPLTSSATSFSVQALDAQGHILARSKVVQPS